MALLPIFLNGDPHASELASKGEHLRHFGCAKAFGGESEVNSFEKVCFPVAIVAREDIEASAKGEIEIT